MKNGTTLLSWISVCLILFVVSCGKNPDSPTGDLAPAIPIPEGWETPPAPTVYRGVSGQ